MRNSFVIAVLAIGVVIGFAGASALQEGEKPAGDEGGMALPEPLNDPISDAMVGKWKWEGKMWHEGQEMPAVAEEVIHWALNNQWVVHGYKMYDADGGVSYEAMALGRPNLEDGTTKLYWFDNHGSVSIWDGKRTETGEEATTENEWGNMKMTVTANEDGSVHHKMWFMPEGAEEWMPMMDMTGTKAGKAKGHMGGGKGEGKGAGKAGGKAGGMGGK